MNYFLTLDAGTTSVKAALWDEDLNLAALSLQEYALLYPRPGWVEAQPETYWNAAVRGVKNVLAEAGVSPGTVCAMACATQGETLIPLDGGGAPIGNAIVWLDARAGEEAAQLRKTFDDKTFFEKTGLPELTGACPAAKALWLAGQPAYAGIRRLLLLEDYLLFRLTGAAASNPALSGSAGWLDIRTDKPWNDMLAAIGLAPDKLPPLQASGTLAGRLSREAARALGLRAGTPVAAGAMDQVACALGAGGTAPGVVIETSGTALVAACALDSFDGVLRSPLTVYRHALPGKYLLLGFSPSAGLWLRWFRDAFCPELTGRADAYAAMDAWAAQALRAGEQVRFTGVGGARAFQGLGVSTTRGGCVLAILTALAQDLNRHLEDIRAYGVPVSGVRSLGGGAKSAFWQNIKSRVCGVPVAAGLVAEATSLGAAMLAKQAVS